MSTFAVNLPEWSARDHSPRGSAGFVPVPRAALYDATLKPGARIVLAILRDHARTTGRCWASQATIAVEAGVSERSVRRHLVMLVSAGLIAVRRRGLTLTNVYTVIQHEKMADPERTIRPVIERDQSEYVKERVVPVEESTDTVASTEITDNAAPIHSMQRGGAPTSHDTDHTQVTNLLADLRRELGDRASAGATITRAKNLWKRSGASFEAFAQAVYAARATTRAHQHAIRRRDRIGTNMVPYFMRVLEERLGLTTHEKKPHGPVSAHDGAFATVGRPESSIVRRRSDQSQPADTEFDALVACVSHPPPRPSRPNRDAFWHDIFAATGIADLPSYCRVAGRPPIYQDLRRSIDFVKARQR